MKKLVFALLVWTWGCCATYAQDLLYNDPPQTEIPKTFNDRFPTKDDLSLRKLRSFLEEKDNQYQSISKWMDSWKRYNYYMKEFDTATLKAFKSKIETFLSYNKKMDPFSDTIDAEIKKICQKMDAEEPFTPPEYNVNLASERINTVIGNIQKTKIAKQSLDNINSDRAAALNAIEQIYSIERGNQEYKSRISLYYAAIILILILTSFLFLFKKSSDHIGNDFLNGNGLQFIALFAIIISTILFGVLGILEGKELAAILSGIAGFILGKGLNVNLTKVNNSENADSNT